MLVVGVGTGLTSNESTGPAEEDLRAGAGEATPTALTGKTINQVDAVAFSDFAALGAFLRSVVTSLCGNSVTVQKFAQSSSGADYVPTTGWDVTVQPTVSGVVTRGWIRPGPDNSPTDASHLGCAGHRGVPVEAEGRQPEGDRAGVGIGEDRLHAEPLEL